MEDIAHDFVFIAQHTDSAVWLVIMIDLLSLYLPFQDFSLKEQIMANYFKRTAETLLTETLRIYGGDTGFDRTDVAVVGWRSLTRAD